MVQRLRSATLFYGIQVLCLTVYIVLISKVHSYSLILFNMFGMDENKPGHKIIYLDSNSSFVEKLAKPLAKTYWLISSNLHFKWFINCGPIFCASFFYALTRRNSWYSSIFPDLSCIGYFFPIFMSPLPVTITPAVNIYSLYLLDVINSSITCIFLRNKCSDNFRRFSRC